MVNEAVDPSVVLVLSGLPAAYVQPFHPIPTLHVSLMAVEDLAELEHGMEEGASAAPHPAEVV